MAAGSRRRLRAQPGHTRPTSAAAPAAVTRSPAGPSRRRAAKRCARRAPAGGATRPAGDPPDAKTQNGMSSGSVSSAVAARGSPAWSARGLGAVLEVDAVELERDPVLAGVGDVLARFEASGEADGLALDEVLGGRCGLRLPDDQVQVDGVGVAVAAVAGDRDGGDGLAGVGGALLDVAGEAAVAGERDHRGTSWVPGGRWLTDPGGAGRPVGAARTHAPASLASCAVVLVRGSWRGGWRCPGPAVGDAGAQASPPASRVPGGCVLLSRGWIRVVRGCLSRARSRRGCRSGRCSAGDRARCSAVGAT